MRPTLSRRRRSPSARRPLSQGLSSSSPISLLTASILVLAFAGPAAAVAHIQNEVWVGEATLPAEGNIQIRVAFDADLTSTDQYRNPFTIGTSALPPGDVLISCFPVRGLPTNAWSAHFEINFTLSCMFGTQMTASAANGRMSYMTSDGAGPFHRDLELDERTAPLASGVVSVRDDSRTPGSNPLALNVEDCRIVVETSGAIGVYFDREGTLCEGTIDPGSTGTVYVVARAELGSAGIAGAEFRFDGVPSVWSIFPVANPEIIALGDPFGDGVTVGFPCWTPQQGPVVLYSVAVLASERASNVRFQLERRIRNSTLPCPLLVSCGPVFESRCVEPKPCFVNATGPTTCATTPVLPKSWATVKSLYRGGSR